MSLFHPIRSECGIGSFNQMSKCVCVCVYIYIYIYMHTNSIHIYCLIRYCVWTHEDESQFFRHSKWPGRSWKPPKQRPSTEAADVGGPMPALTSSKARTVCILFHHVPSNSGGSDDFWWFLMVLCHLQHVRHVGHVINITCHYVESTKQAFSSMTLVTFPCYWGLGPCAQCRGRLYSQHFPHTWYRAENSTRRCARKGWSWWNFGGYHGKQFIV